MPGVALPADSLCFGEVPETFDWPLFRSSATIQGLARKWHEQMGGWLFTVTYFSASPLHLAIPVNHQMN